MTRSIVVGIDGSREAGYALAWAIREARLRELPLRIVHAGRVPEDADDAVVELLSRAEQQAHIAEPGLELSTEQVDGRPVPALAGFMTNAAMVVVGRRGVGGFTGLLLGSVAHGLSQVATCPVVTVPSPELPVVNRVVVGVQSAEEDQSTIEFAFEAAARRRAELRAVHAWERPTPLGVGDVVPLVYDLDSLQADETELVTKVLKPWRHRYPDVHADGQAVRGHAVRVLDQRSSDAVLLVVGRHGGGRRLPVVLGSVAHGVLHHARCPVAVVPPSAEN